jgi:hypothetical protein
VIRGVETGAVSAGEIVDALRDLYERRPAVAEPVPASALA